MSKQSRTLDVTGLSTNWAHRAATSRTQVSDPPIPWPSRWAQDKSAGKRDEGTRLAGRRRDGPARRPRLALDARENHANAKGVDGLSGGGSGGHEQGNGPDQRSPLDVGMITLTFPTSLSGSEEGRSSECSG